MSRKASSISASLRARRALLLAEGRRRFYVFPLDCGPNSRLAKIAHSSTSDCVAAAHAWLQRARVADSWWFSVVEKAEMDGESVWASVQDILVFNDLLPLQGRLRNEGGCDSGAGPQGLANREQAEAAPEVGTFKATNGCGVPCRRREVPQYA